MQQHDKVITQLKLNLQTAYRQSIDADKRLDELQKEGLGKFTAVFHSEHGFKTNSNRFLPYVKELAAEVQSLEDSSATPSSLGCSLNKILPKLATILHTLQTFKQKAK